MSVQNHGFAALDRFQANIEEHGFPRAIQELVSDLAAQRAAIPPLMWKEWCANASQHSAFDVLLQDAYSRDARLKPAGYAGDARTLDYVYLRNPGNQELTPAGHELFRLTTNVPIAKAVRDRCETLGHYIYQLLKRQQFSAISCVACGHVRELECLNPDLLERIQYWGMDQDAETIRACKAQHGSPNFHFETGAVSDVLQGRLRLPASDLVYASGLFDYLESRVARLLLRRMYASLNAGGVMVIPNLSPVNDEIGYMEAVMDWWMQYRDATAMAQLAADSFAHAPDCKFEVFSTFDNRVVWLQVTREPH